jgi:hypothetical protein
MDYLSIAIQNLKPNSEFTYQENDYSTVNWIVLDGNAPTQKQIDDEIKKIKAAEIVDLKAKQTAKAAILDRIGLTADELKMILG